MAINTDNYELFLFQYMEGSLSEEERAEVEAFLASHPDITEEMSLYDPNLRIPTNDDLLFPGTIPMTVVASHRPSRRQLAIAACLLFALVTSGLAWLTLRDTSSTIPLAQNEGTNHQKNDRISSLSTPNLASKEPKSDTTLVALWSEHGSTLMDSLIALKSADTSTASAPVVIESLCEVPEEPLIAQNTPSSPTEEVLINPIPNPSSSVIILSDDLITYVDQPRNSSLLDKGIKLGNAIVASTQTVNRMVNNWGSRIGQLYDTVTTQLRPYDIFS